MRVITVTNIETGTTRIVRTDESGVYRFPLLPLGTYRITAEAANFNETRPRRRNLDHRTKRDG